MCNAPVLDQRSDYPLIKRVRDQSDLISSSSSKTEEMSSTSNNSGQVRERLRRALELLNSRFTNSSNGLERFRGALAELNLPELQAIESVRRDNTASLSTLLQTYEQFAVPIQPVNSRPQPLRADETSGPQLQRLGILGLPDEILTKISENVTNWSPYYPVIGLLDLDERNVDDIKNLRLTCRRLYNTSSHLLQASATVHLDPLSIARLNRLTNLPIISRGVVKVRVILAFYESELASSIHRFVSHNYGKLRDTVNMYRQSDNGDLSLLQRPGSREKLDKMANILDSWERFLRGEPDFHSGSEELLVYFRLLLKAHAEYQYRFAVQERLLKDATFEQVIAAAIAKMLCLKRMEIADVDEWELSPGDFLDLPSDPDAFKETLLLRMRWDEARRSNWSVVFPYSRRRS